MAIVIDGIIGAGKTTVGQIISEAYHIPFYEELKSKTENNLAQRMLDQFYHDQNRWSAIIQVMFLNERFKDLKAVEHLKTQALFDRSIYGDEVFARTINDRGQMSDDEFDIYLSLLKNMLEHIHPPELLIYLDVSVDKALSRIKKRSRSTEASTIPRDYMVDLKKHYEAWFNAFDLCPKVRLNLEGSFDATEEHFDPELKEKILELVKPYIY
ncbi:MAG: deoxynucleoside kinase [Clostridia bacterium]|nr:deoxynucleoside kinase [Clostridia bacterium]